MPVLTAQLSPAGPLIDVFVLPSRPRLAAMQAAGQPAPPPCPGRFLIDTGASVTVIDQTIVRALGIVPTGVVPMHTPSTGAAAHIANQFDVTLVLALPTPPHAHVFSWTLPVLEADFSAQGIHGLLGRDLLLQCVLGYNGIHGHIFLAV